MGATAALSNEALFKKGVSVSLSGLTRRSSFAPVRLESLTYERLPVRQPFQADGTTLHVSEDGGREHGRPALAREPRRGEGSEHHTAAFVCAARGQASFFVFMGANNE